ncbi:hypothetical protein BJG93_30930 (plasmid) [Paraburkholderia sprentiae WSM5005]|uniref:Uncharacterized protein n=1 Tax=Paraburkholderia sprentiae WSM5005 TaxID=754502 RepID=A0A1I9YUJ7_9BURK|nr:hypothetical protein [Paraburkholderia sprentiae]APA89870.1 hypothetical protein BJG93_30930 [Paraburkholderia sprentiae WSM5005]
MASQQQQPNTPKTGNADESGAGNEGTFETDISETGEDGTSVRQAEVKEKDLSEVKPSQEKGGQ